MQDSEGRVRLYGPNDEVIKPKFMTRFPTPDGVRATKVMKALEKLAGCTEPVRRSDAALMNLTPFEQGYVLGILTSIENGRVL